jgi:hypothetical protein
MDLHPDLMDLLAAFANSNVEYLIVGSWAVSYYSEPRYTKDLDILVGTDDANFGRLVSALSLFGVPPHILVQAKSLRDDEFLFFGSPPARVDVLRSIPGACFEDAFKRRVDVQWNDVPVSIISRDDLLAAKRAAGRERDLRDVRALERAAKATE